MSTDDQHPYGNNPSTSADEHAARLLEERDKFPFWMLLGIEEEIRTGAPVDALLFPHSDLRYRLVADGKLHYLRGFELPRLLVGEFLEDLTALRLRSALATIRSIHALSSYQAFAFLLQVFLLCIDVFGAKAGKESWLFGPIWEDLDPRPEIAEQQHKCLATTPRWSLDQILEVWSLFGGQLVRDWHKPASDATTVTNYCTIPPTVFPVEVLEAYSLSPSQFIDSTIPLRVDRSLASVALSFLDLYKASATAGVPMVIGNGAQPGRKRGEETNGGGRSESRPEELKHALAGALREVLREPVAVDSPSAAKTAQQSGSARQGGRGGRKSRFPQDARSDVVLRARELKAGGRSWEEIGVLLGMAKSTLYRWDRELRRKPGL